MRLPIVVALVTYGALLAAGGVLFTINASADPVDTPTPAASAVDPTKNPAPADPTASARTGHDALPGGVTGRVSYRKQGELITVALPSGEEVGRETVTEGARSPHGRWALRTECESGCTLTFTDGSTTQTASISGQIIASAWAPDGGAYAVTIGDGSGVVGVRVLVITLDGSAGEPIVALRAPAVHGIAWYDGALLASVSDAAGQASLVLARDGGEPIAVATTDAPAPHLYPSPDGRSFVFTQASALGWRLAAFDAVTREVRDLGAMGSDGPGAPPVEVAPEQKGPMAVEWSPDGGRVAFGGGYSAPYHLNIVDIRAGRLVRVPLPDGYAGEVRWSPDGSRIAISTYAEDRSSHTVYTVVANTGELRYLIGGCVIVWSPDGRFLALHGADGEEGVVVIDVASGAHGHLTGSTEDEPQRWTE